MEEKSYKSWTISDEFWDKVKNTIPDTAGKRAPIKLVAVEADGVNERLKFALRLKPVFPLTSV